MQFKDLFHKKNILRVIIVAIVIFLCLPIIFPEETEFKIIRKESIYTHEDSPLPIFPKESLLDKYVNKLKKFYKMDVPVFTTEEKEQNQPKKNNRKEKQSVQANTEAESEVKTETNTKNKNIEITKEDLFFSAAFDKEDDVDLLKANDNYAIKDGDDSVNLQKGTVLTKDGLILEPTQDGYYNKGKFYKNGTYPRNADRLHIEGALSRYHSRIAKNLGKKALYLADENGNLTVSYVDDLPNEISTNIDTYLAQKQNKYQNVNVPKSKAYDEKNEKYQNSQITGFYNPQIDNSDIVSASIKDIHAAYNLLNNKIQTGNIGQGLLPTLANVLPLGNILLNRASVAQPPIENPEDDIFCHGDECADSLRVSPNTVNEEGISSSDLDDFYESFCEEICLYSGAYRDTSIAEKPLNWNPQSEEDLNQLKEEIANSDKKIVEIAYIHPKEDYKELLTSLQEMSLTNKNGEPVEIRLRGIEKIGSEASFGDKMVGPFKNNITRDLISESNEVSYETLVERYNKVNEDVQDNIDQNKFLQYYKEFYPDLNFNPPIAFVERSDDPNFFIINNPDIPKGYVNDIPQWEKYKKDDGMGTYYRVPKNALFNPPSELAIIAVQDGKKRDISLQDGHPVGNISKEVLQNLNFNNVESTKTEIANIQIETILYNAKKLDEEEGKGK